MGAMALRFVEQAQLSALARPLLVDVREPGEFEGERLPGSVNAPLSDFDARMKEIPRGAPVVVICRTGRRAEDAARRLEAAGLSEVLVLAGGLSACSGLERGPGSVWAMERQVRMAAGLLVTTGLVLAWAVHPAFALLSAGVGLGLVYSAASDSCGMALVLARLPWNRRAPSCGR